MIVIQFVQGTDIGAKLIEWFGGGPAFSHVDAVLPDGSLLGARSDEVGGASAGVQIRSPDYTGNNKVLRVSIPFGDQEKFYLFLYAQIGRPYDKEAIAGFITGRNWKEDNAWFCSELIAVALEAAEVFEDALMAPVNKISPADLLLVLSAIVPIHLEGN